MPTNKFLDYKVSELILPESLGDWTKTYLDPLKESSSFLSKYQYVLSLENLSSISIISFVFPFICMAIFISSFLIASSKDQS